MLQIVLNVAPSPELYSLQIFKAFHAFLLFFFLIPSVVWYSIPLKVIRGDQLIYPPDHNISFKMITLKLKVDSKHRLLILNTCNVEYFRNTPTDLCHVSSAKSATVHWQRYLNHEFHPMYKCVPCQYFHSFILETYIAPLQETTTQRRSQPSHGQKKKDLREM